MSFSASTCLTYTGTTTLTDPISIYSNSDGYLVPFTTVTLSQITSGNCPLVLLEIPDGTTTIQLISSNNYCGYITLECNDLCTTCDLAFDAYSTNLISRIVAGNLTGSCDNTITDYRINWYKDGSTTPVFTSGYGTEFIPYNFTHPLVGVSSPMQPSGIYTPVVDKVIINGLNYSQTGGEGFIQANLECFDSSTIVVSPFNCSNGTELGDYTHRVQFSGASAGVTPLTLTSTFDLDLTTNYFPWKFSGAAVPDSLKISFSGSSYSDPIILEYWVIGGTVPVTDVLLSVLPKSATTNGTISKVTSLMSLNRNIGDYLILEVIPNQSNPQTNWDFYFTCLENFDCSLCTDSYVNSNTSYKIKLASVTNVSQSCGQRAITYELSGCTKNQFNSSDIGKYMVTNFSNVYTGTNAGTNNVTSLLTLNRIFSTGTTECFRLEPTQPIVCGPISTNTIQFQKTIVAGVGVINMTFTDLNDLIVYKSSYDARKSFWVNNPTNLDYYQFAYLIIPNTTPTGNCGDGVGYLRYAIHFSSIITTGGTPGNYTLTMPMPTITNSLPPFNVCQQNCNSWLNDIITEINTDSTGTTNNTVGFRTTNTGARYTIPFNSRVYVRYVVGAPTYSATTGSVVVIDNGLNSTFPFSGNSYPYTQIPALSSHTCDFSSVGETRFIGDQNESQWIYINDYNVVITNPPDLTSFSIKANTIVNGVRTSTNYPEIALTYSGGAVTYANPLYTF